jgi:uncharacterized membrane protein YfcA
MTNERVTGFEISEQLEATKTSIWERAIPGRRQIIGFFIGLIPLVAVFFIGCWLAGNPLGATWRTPDSAYNVSHGLVGTNQWSIIWIVVVVGLFFEFMDASAGMGFGTVMSPVLMSMGFTPLQVVPAIMIQQATCGMVGTFLHREFENVEWKFSPMSETIKLWLLISILGVLAIVISITSVYAIFKVAKVWIKLYVTLLLLGMGVVAVYQAATAGGKKRPYRFKRMAGFAFLAGFNKGIGGGGYGPVITIGGILSGIPIKSQLAVTAICEGTVSTVAAIVWFSMLAGGNKIDFLLLPTMMITAIGGGILAPYATRVFPQKFWTYTVPAYCLIIVAYLFYKLAPSLMKALGV